MSLGMCFVSCFVHFLSCAECWRRVRLACVHCSSWWLLIVLNVMSLLHASRKWPEKVLCGCSWWKADKSVSHQTQYHISMLHLLNLVRCRFAAIVFFGTNKVRARKAFVILSLFLRANVTVLHVQATVRHPCLRLAMFRVFSVSGMSNDLRWLLMAVPWRLQYVFVCGGSVRH